MYRFQRFFKWGSDFSSKSFFHRSRLLGCVADCPILPDTPTSAVLRSNFPAWLSTSRNQPFVNHFVGAQANRRYGSSTRAYSTAAAKTAADSSADTSAEGELHFEASKRVLPHPSKVARGGEDACFTSTLYLGVADGVGSWTERGVDPGIYPRELLVRVQQELQLEDPSHDVGGEAYSNIIKQLLQLPPLPPARQPNNNNMDPRSVLQRAYKQTRSPGATTCCLVFLDPARRCIHTANLGDSGFLVFRPSSGKVCAKSVFQQHTFNMPYQLGHQSSDRPESAAVDTISVEPGDWIVLATDGLWDNLYDLQITDILKAVETTREAVDEIAELAVRYSLEYYWNSPFIEAEKRYLLKETFCIEDERFSINELLQMALARGANPDLVGQVSRLNGGKPDDVSVVVARVA